jgi:hypothetical protein
MGAGCLLLEDEKKEKEPRKVVQAPLNRRSISLNDIKETNRRSLLKNDRFEDLSNFQKPVNMQLPARLIPMRRPFRRGSFKDPILCLNRWTGS